MSFAKRTLRTLRAGGVGLVVLAASIVPLSAVSSQAQATATGWCRPGHCLLGPTTPKAASTRGMRGSIVGSKTVLAGDEIHMVAKGFENGEYATVWLYTGVGFGHSSQLNGGVAEGGSLDVYRQTVAGITDAEKQKICVQGVRTKRVACATYKVKAAEVDGSDSGDSGYQSPTIGPGYVPPASS